ncbi:MAG: YdcF family protein [Desulfobacterales bacterium]|nr:YdcF family protein [Desulfobacterales bacterium]
MDYKDETPQEKTDELGLPEKLDKKRKGLKFSILKWLIFLFFIIYFVLTSYRVPLLIKLGEYLIVEHKPQKADLIVCLGGRGVENALAAIDAYKKGLAPYIFRAKELKPDGLDYLKKTVKTYPTNFDLFTMIVDGFGIPEKMILSSEDRVGSTISEARLVRKLVLDRGFKSLIVITTLTHSRRAWLTFKKVFKDYDIRIISLPSHYQLYNPKDWWTKRKYTKALIIEYQKLIYYKIAYLI